MTFRLVDPDVEDDLRAVHDVLEEAFTDHFNSKPETFDEFVHRLREDPGTAGTTGGWPRWTTRAAPVGALVGTESGSGSYVSYIGVVGAARGRGVAKGLLRTIIADAAAAWPGHGEPRGRRGLVDRRRPALRVVGLGDGVRHGVVAPRRAGPGGVIESRGARDSHVP